MFDEQTSVPEIFVVSITAGAEATTKNVKMTVDMVKNLVKLREQFLSHVELSKSIMSDFKDQIYYLYNKSSHIKVKLKLKDDKANLFYNAMLSHFPEALSIVLKMQGRSLVNDGDIIIGTGDEGKFACLVYYVGEDRDVFTIELDTDKLPALISSKGLL